MGIVDDYWKALGSNDLDELVESENVVYDVQLGEDDPFTYWGA